MKKLLCKLFGHKHGKYFFCKRCGEKIEKGTIGFDQSQGGRG
jgi:hypothetical protein